MNPELIYPQLGQLIRRRRKQFKWTQEKLAARLGISRGSLANIETGRQKVLVHQLYSVAAALDMSPHDLLPTLEAAVVDVEPLRFSSELKPQQKEQISRLMADTQPEPVRNREGTHVKQAKR